MSTRRFLALLFGLGPWSRTMMALDERRKGRGAGPTAGQDVVYIEDTKRASEYVSSLFRSMMGPRRGGGG